ncbi:MAG TPA: MarR family winged helix-turn-helix transcriptional regulator [Kofleriaceae bacterium]|jgi:DNA-binding MarR family transcriptional regulator
MARIGLPSLRATHVQLLSQINTADGDSEAADAGVRLADLVASVSLPKQTVGDLIDDLEEMKMVERFPDPDHGVIKRVRLGPKGKVWAAEVRRVAAATEARWTTRLGAKKMKSLRALLEELASTVETAPTHAATNGKSKRG